jgi:putative endonuclease
MTPVAYIIYSQKLDKYYVGSSENFNERIVTHNSDENENWSKVGRPWQEYLIIVCSTGRQARRIEKYIKKMKSRKYIEYLASDPENVVRLKNRFL